MVAGGLLVIFGVAALVFDGGIMLLEKRDQQNAADAAAIAGARFLPIDQGAAEGEAIAVASINGYTDGAGDQTVTITFPSAGRIAVVIDDITPSFFAGIWGIFGHDVASRAVAVNEDRSIGPFGLLALEPTDCDALKVTGGGIVDSQGDIQVNSNCQPNAMRLGGQGEVLAAPNVGCNVVGGFEDSNNTFHDCVVTEGAVPIPDPFAGLSPPPIPMDGGGVIVYPPAVVKVSGGGSIPSGCPGSASPASHTSPRLCSFNTNGTTWRLFPGYYPGGLEFKKGNIYFEPGIYYIGGGGVDMNSSGAFVTSVEPGGTTLGGGVMFFNTDSPGSPSDMHLNGGNADLRLHPMETGPYAGIVLFQDRDFCEPILLNGGSSALEVRGTIYAACAQVRANGNGAGIMTDQIIADTFDFMGNGGGVNVLYDSDFLPTLSLAGLIE